MAAVGWLIKVVITNKLNQEAEAFKAHLQADADAQIEQLKNSLQMVAIEHQVRFSKLHKRRAEVIAELYKQLRETHWAVQRFVYGDTNNLEFEQSAWSKLVDLYHYAELNRLYLPQAECILLDEIIGKLRTSHIFVRTYSQIPNPTAKTLQEQFEVMRKASETLDTHIPALTDLLEKEFRALLGVVNKVEPLTSEQQSDASPP